METIKVKINNKEYELLHAVTEKEKEKGLQNVTEMDDNEGCFFDYREDPQETVNFWMKDTEIPLDIIFVGEDDTVISVQQGLPYSEDYLTEYNVYYVIELNIHSGVVAGDEVEIEENEELPKLFVLNPDGSVQFEIMAGNRIFSRKSTRVIIRKAKKAYKSKSDSDYKALGRYVFNELTAQDKREPEYTEKS